MAARDDQLLTRRRLASLSDPPAPAPPAGGAPLRTPVPGPSGRHAWRAPEPAELAPDSRGPDHEPDPDPDCDPDEPWPDEPSPDDAPAGVRVLRPRVGRGWQERWVPAGWRGHRWDPGRRGGLALAVVAAAAAVIAAVGVWRDRPVAEPLPALPVVASPAAVSDPAPGARLPAVPGPSATPAASAPAAPLVVSVAGAVAGPGLVRVPAGSRVADVIAAAGGALPGTDLLSLNLAAPVADGEQVVVGAPGPPATGAPGGGAGAASSAAGAAPASGAAASGAVVNLNTADLAALDGLPGVGPVTAQKILDHRTQNGPFTSVDQLTEVSGIGEARLASLRDLVTV